MKAQELNVQNTANPEFITVKEAEEKWGMSGQIIRRYCRQDRIPGAKIENGIWVVPASAEKPPRLNAPAKTVTVIPKLARKLYNQKKKKNPHGLYDYVVIDLTYNSCRMASNRLTRYQVETIFRKGKVSVSFEPMKVSDLIEVQNHCLCVDHILDTIMKPLTTAYIKNLHHMLSYGTLDDRHGKVVPGQYRNKASARKEDFAGPTDSIARSLSSLVANYEARKEIKLQDILDFHVKFEQIFPFDDCNGRIGRLIMFKECLRHNVMPFILDDKRRSRYLEGIREWDKSRYALKDVAITAQERFEAEIERMKGRQDSFGENSGME